MKKPELLLPAKDLETLILDIKYGADAVYLAAKDFGLRKKATNFSYEELKTAIEFAHENKKLVYITANIVARNEDIKNAQSFFEKLKELSPDGILVSDLGMLNVLKRVWPEANVHISTQAGNSNYETFNFYYDLGIRRVVCERLLTLEEIKEIREKIPEDMEIECFVHGAMCISYSGKCLLSAALTGKNANLGECTHPCRWNYALVESKRQGEYFPVFEEEGTYIMNSKDLCMIDKIPDLFDCGINSLKIEGRMKNILYTTTMAKSYRQAIDTYFESPSEYERIKDKLLSDVNETTHRPYSYGFYYGDNMSEGITGNDNDYISDYVYLGYVQEAVDEYAVIEQKNKFNVGDTIEVMRSIGDNISVKVLKITDEMGNEQESAPHPKQKIFIYCDKKLMPFDILKMQRKDN